MTDGATAGVDLYGLHESWDAFIRDALDHGPQSIVAEVVDAEATDPNGQRWPRSKVSDDKTAVQVRLLP
jgi:hypothetical protein